MSPLAELHRHLDTALAYGPSYNGRLSNHLPMALHAAWELGAEGERLQVQLFHEAPKLVVEPPSMLQLQIAAEIEAEGAEVMLRRHVAMLISMPHAGLFHGVIRTAHAWEGGHAGELAAALAYWTGLWVPDTQPIAIVDEHWRDCRQRLIDRALDAYLKSRNFYVLHLITGMRAVRVLSRFVPDVPQVSGWLLRGYEAGWARADYRAILSAPQDDPPSWPLLRQAALAQLDDHVIKLVHACWQEDRLRPDKRWRQAAALATDWAAVTPAV